MGSIWRQGKGSSLPGFDNHDALFHMGLWLRFFPTLSHIINLLSSKCLQHLYTVKPFTYAPAMVSFYNFGDAIKDKRDMSNVSHVC